MGKSRSMAMQGLNRADARLLRLLRQRSHREAEGLFVAEGVRVVEELLRSSLDLRFAVIAPGLSETERGRQLSVELAARTTVHTTSDVELRQLADTETPQGVLVCAVIPQSSLPTAAPATALVLDGIQDPGNVGTLLRSAVAFGAGIVISLPGTVDVWNGKTVRAAAGTSFHVPIVTATASQLRSWCDGAGVSLWGAAAEGSVLDAAERPARVALVLGNEGAGLREDARAVLDRTVALRMSGRAESLNAAVAGGILLYLLTEGHND
jgi:TrmH family RNA methyltransferase